MRLEARRGGDVTDGGGHLMLEASRRRDVRDLAAADAQQMVMVLGQILGELEPGELVAGRDPPDQAGGLQVRQMPVGRAARQIRQALGDVANAHGMATAEQELNDGAPAAGIALIDPPQAPLGDAVQIVRQFLSRHQSSSDSMDLPGPAALVLVVVVAIGSVPVTVMDIVHVVVVRHRLVAAAGAVLMLMTWVSQVR